MTESTTSFVHQRDLPFTPERVYAAFADPAQLSAWWGPSGFRNHFEHCDFREGGTWQFVMEGPDGKRHPNRSRFLRLQPGVAVHLQHESAPRFTLRVDLSPQGSGTRLDWVQQFEDPAVAAAVAAIVEPANEQNLDRLAALLRGVRPA
jgi:uncharacterized protein YndB with AHSA1/START domain